MVLLIGVIRGRQHNITTTALYWSVIKFGAATPSLDIGAKRPETDCDIMYKICE